jgi:hypothetical protein
VSSPCFGVAQGYTETRGDRSHCTFFRTDENAIPVEPVWFPQRRHHPAYDPLLDNEPELARTLAASVKQRIAFGQRAGEKVRRIDSGFASEGEGPELKGSRCASVNGFSLHANTEIPALRRRLGVEVGIELVGPEETAPLTEINRRQKPIRLIDERTTP